MNNPLISIIIPTYGGPNLLSRALDSILNQTLKEWEVLVVDDNGKGLPNQLLTENAIKPYLLDERIHYLVHEVNKNGSAARNTGFRQSLGKYIALFDDDDEYLPIFLQSQMLCLEKQNPDCGMVYCSYEQYFEGEKQRTVHALKKGWLLYDTLMHSFEIPTSSWLIKREVFSELGGFDESFYRHQDWEFLNRLAAKYQIQANDTVCYKRHIGFRNSPKNPEQFIAYRKHYLEKMDGVIILLQPKERKHVLISNQIDAIIPLLKTKQFFRFIKEFISIRPGLYGIKFLINRLFKL